MGGSTYSSVSSHSLHCLPPSCVSVCLSLHHPSHPLLLAGDLGCQLFITQNATFQSELISSKTMSTPSLRLTAFMHWEQLPDLHSGQARQDKHLQIESWWWATEQIVPASCRTNPCWSSSDYWKCRDTPSSREGRPPQSGRVSHLYWNAILCLCCLLRDWLNFVPGVLVARLCLVRQWVYFSLCFRTCFGTVGWL